MRNLKRVLSLALAAMMLIGMMVVGASAADIYDDFTDKDEIVNTEAVSTLVTLGVIDGKEDGSYFAPNDTVTRGEMAKIICIMLNGGEEPVLGVKDTPTFSDIDNHWAEKYIEYCVSMGIIDGRGDGTFDPDATVTGTEAAKMYLTALGYDAKVFGFTGNDWAINVNTKANEPKVELYTRLKGIDPNAGLSRDNTAQMAYNTLNARLMTIIPSKTLTTGEIVYEYILAGTFLSEKFGITKFTGVLLSNDTYGLGATSGIGYSEIEVRTVDGEDWVNTMSIPQDYTVKSEADNDLIGQEVVVFEKQSITGEKVVVGDIIATQRNKVVTTYDKLDAGLDATKADSVARFVKLSGLKLVDYDGTVTPSTGTKYFNNNTQRNASATYAAGDLANIRGQEMTLIDNNSDGIVEFVLQTDYTLAKVASKDETTGLITLNNGSLVYSTDALGYDDVAVGDIVTYSVKNGVYDLAVAETVEGELTAYTAPSGASHGNISLDGTVYAPSQMANAMGSFTTVLNNINGTNLKLNATYRLYLDRDGNAIAAEEITAVSNYALVLDSGSKKVTGLSGDNDYTSSVKLLLADGSTGIYNVDLLSSAANYYNKADELGATTIGTKNYSKDDDNTERVTLMAELLANGTNDTNNKDDKIKNTLVNVTINGDTVILAPVAKQASEIENLNGEGRTNVAISKGVTYWNNRYVMNSSTVFFCSSAADNGGVYTGVQNIPAAGFTAAQVVDFDYDLNTNVVKAVYVDYEIKASSNNFYSLGAPSVATVDGVRVWQYKGLKPDGTVITLNSKVNAGNSTVYTYTLDSNDYATLTVMPQLDTQTVKAGYWFSGTVVAINDEAITMVDKNGTRITVAIDSDGLDTWNVVNTITGETAPTIELNENYQATLVFKTEDDMVVAEAAYVTDMPTTYAVTFGGNTYHVLPGTVVDNSVVTGMTGSFVMPAYDVTLVGSNPASINAALADNTVDAVVVTGSTNIGSAAVTVADGKTLIINDNFFCGRNNLIVNEGGTVVINGNATINGTSKIDGTLTVTGTLYINNDNVDLNGNVSAGNLTLSGGTTTVSGGKIAVSGTLTDIAAGTDFSDATVEADTLVATTTKVGKATVKTVTVNASLTVADGKTLTVTGECAAAHLEKIKGDNVDEGAKLVIKTKSGSPATDTSVGANLKFWATAGVKDSSNGTDALDTLNRIEAHTYTWTKAYYGTSGDTELATGAWVVSQ